MRRTLLSLSLLLIGSIGYSQVDIPDVDISKRKEYVMKNYNVDSKKADRYEDILHSLQQEKEQLRNTKISSIQFKADQRKLYKKYGTFINQAFYDGKDRRWSFCTQELEHYHVFSESKFIPYEQMRALFDTEKVWLNKRERMSKESTDESKKYENNEALLTELNKNIKQILGEENGSWYIAYKRTVNRALGNMDKYGASYNEAFAIAQIEETYKQKRVDILNSSKKHADKEVEMMKNDKEMSKQIAVAVPLVFEKWKKVNNAMLDYTLISKYGLSQEKLADFKKAYSKYAIEEYKILNQKKQSDADKYIELSKLSEEFCKTVTSLFSAANYTKWSGWWKYNFERKMKRKGLK